MNQEQKIAKEIWFVLQQLKEDYLLTPDNKYVNYEVEHSHQNSGYPSVHNQLKIIKKLEHLQAIKVIREYFFTRRGTTIGDSFDIGKYQDVDPKGMLIDILRPKFDELYGEYSHLSAEPITLTTEMRKYVIEVKDRNIWVNEFLLCKPHAVGKNMSLFEYAFEHPNKSILRDELPKLLKVEIAGKSISKVLNELGFKSEILKAFFPERGKDQLLFRKEVTLSQLAKDNINTDLLMQELRIAHLKNYPK